MSNLYPYNTSTNFHRFNGTPQFNIATEPHYKIQNYLEEEAIYNPNKRVLNKIITKAINQKKYQGRIDLNVPGNKDVLTDSDSEEHYINVDNIKKINKNMLKQNGCANLIIKKIESQAPQRNEEYYKFTNQKKIYANNDPFYGTRTLTNWNQREFDDKKIRQIPSLYVNTDQNINYNKNNNYNNAYEANRILTLDNTDRKNQKVRDNNYNNYLFNSTLDLRQINPKIKKIKKQNRLYEINRSPNQQISYESSADAEQGSSSYVYLPAKTTDIKYKKIKKNNLKDNELSVQSISNNEEPYIRKNLEIKSERLKNKNKNIPKKRPSFQELIRLNSKNTGFNILQNKFTQKLIKNVIIIQSVWRGYLTRGSIYKNLNLIRFAIVLVENIKNKYFDYISEAFYNMKYTKIRSEKNENYDDLLKDYNLLLKEYEKIEKEMNEIKKIQKTKTFENLNIVKKENNFEILDIILDSQKENKEKENNIIKKFDIIQKEQNDEFSIMKLNEKRANLRGRYKGKKEKIENKNEININHFLSNINRINIDKFKIEGNIQTNPKKENKISSNNNFSYLKEIKKENEMSKDNYIQRKFEINLEIEKKNDINILPNIEQNKLNKQKLILYHHYFKDNDFIIVKKVNLNIIKEKQIKNYSIDNNINTFCLGQIKKIEQDNLVTKNDFNKINEIEKNCSLEINTLEMKKYNQRQNNLIINTENDLSENKDIKSESSFSENAKLKMLKMIFPIKLKATLKEFARRNVIKVLKKSE